MFLIRRILRVATVLSATLLVAGTGCSRAPERTLRVGLLVWPGFEPAYLARQLGYLDTTQVQLVDYAGSEMRRAMRNGLLDAVGLTLTSAIQQYAADTSLRAVMVLDISNGGDAILGGRGVRSIRDLKGRRVAVSPSGGSAYLVMRALESVGLHRADVQHVKTDETSLERALREGRVAAVMTYEPLRSQLIDSGATQLFSTADIPGEVSDVLLTRSATVRDRPEALRAFAVAWYRAREDMRAYPDSMARLIAPRERVKAAQFRMMAQGLDWPDRQSGLQMLQDTASALFDGGRRSERLLVELGLIPTGVQGTRMIDARVTASLP